MDDNCHILSFGRVNIDTSDLDTDPDLTSLPLMATRNLVLFPGVTIPIALMRPASRQIAKEANERKIPIGIVCQIDASGEGNTSLKDLFDYGVIADVLQIIDLPDGEQTAIVRGRDKFRILGKGATQIIPDALHANVRIVSDRMASKRAEFNVLMKNLRELTEKLSRADGNEGMLFSVSNIENNAEFVNTTATNLRFDPAQKMKMLATNLISRRAFLLYSMLLSLAEQVEVANRIKERARMGLQEQNKNAFLMQQMNAIREELYGDEDSEIDEIRKKFTECDLPKEVASSVGKEIERLAKTNPQTPDYTTLLTYIETVLDLPWKNTTELNSDFDKAEKQLNADHYGLEKVKDRILEQMAVMMNNPDGKAPIICLVGAPGVGKTSLGVSIAAALGRNYQRVALGGLHDEAEIRGHRRTYVGAMPGRIISAMRRAKSKNPVILLDEIDKIGADFKGDPSAALLEVLDPEQNCHFHDNYIDLDFDLSDVLFIATANSLATISQPLIDRMEVIELSGYLPQEKMEIARRHLLPRISKRLKAPEDFVLGDDALSGIIEDYTAESGVRQLEKQLASIIRKVILRKMQHRDVPATIHKEDLKEFLGLPVHRSDRYEGNSFAGVVTGLAWTAVGGEILFVEASLSKGKGEKLTLTGNLGDVMKESAMIALQYVKSHAAQLGISSEALDSNNIHIHVPEGAIPKDGPSAGITMATAIVSALTGMKVRNRLAMTGEITLRGKVLPVGGIKEKILAAKRAGIHEIILSEENRRDIEDINSRYVEGLQFHYVQTVLDVIRIAVTDEKAPL